MFGLTTLELARIQFGFTISFHIIFPAITIGLASYVAVLEGLWLWKKEVVYRARYQFWSKIFAVNFAMGVVSGLVMAYQFGTNWSYFSAFAGTITGPLLAYEVLTAFFLEAGFLGVMLFGWNKVGAGLHFFATAMVATGTLISATWILFKQLDADSAGVRDHGRACRAGRLAQGDIQSFIPLPTRAHDQCGLPGDGPVRRRFRRVTSPA
jgi:cytochrome d ubiquinol oxidase subunit I